MSKYRLSWNQNKLSKLIKEGRGQGTGKEYVPWISIHDFPSHGNSIRTPGWKTNRIHHFMSNNELRYFYILEWSDLVVDIREQYPLLDVDLAVEIAEQAGIKYPIDNKTSAPYVLSTDFMITVHVDGNEVNIARTIKPSTDLEKARVIEKFEIERRYWKLKNIDWGIVTEKEINSVMAKNIEWVHSAYRLEFILNLNQMQYLRISNMLKQRFNTSQESIKNITSRLDTEMEIEPGTSLYIFKHLIAVKDITIDMKSRINVSAAREVNLDSKNNQSSGVAL